MRFSLDRVCTHSTPPSFLSTYMAQSLGWSKPVWNFWATIITWKSSVSKASRMSRPLRPGFMLLSVKLSPNSPPTLGSGSANSTSPEKATMAWGRS